MRTRSCVTGHCLLRPPVFNLCLFPDDAGSGYIQSDARAFILNVQGLSPQLPADVAASVAT